MEHRHVTRGCAQEKKQCTQEGDTTAGNNRGRGHGPRDVLKDPSINCLFVNESRAELFGVQRSRRKRKRKKR